ncbi:MAG TPA: hypothetical protein GYA07_13645 [Verrucomicrobia bacterium]|nr:hypothetical protein [Verrucomicrobiota bacterium]HOP98564.1 hypothetical protein [Verrucomicrobiota bacterium]
MCCSSIRPAWPRCLIALALAWAAACCGVARGATGSAAVDEFVVLASEQFAVEPRSAAVFGMRIEAPEREAGWRPFAHAAVKQGTNVARLGPRPDAPHFAVRFALPIPPDNDTNLTGKLAGMDPYVWAHNHSPGLEVLPNGDLLAIYFSAYNPRGSNESAPSARFIQARLRHGAQEWDPPELFFDSRDFNDQSALLWVDGDTIRFFGGGRDISPLVPFKMAISTDHGVTWTLSLPFLAEVSVDYTPQPVVNAFRGPAGMYMVMDAERNESFLWHSPDGVIWRDMRGRTGGRHSTIVPLGDGRLLSVGGKNTGINGFSPQNISTNWGATWLPNEPSPFPALGGNQRPSMIRLANGHLCLVTDSYHRNKQQSPEGWQGGEGCFVAISTNRGADWHFKRLPVALPHEADRKNGTLGYATVRQAPNGLIHVLSTMTHPCLHYEFNEAWVFSDLGEVPEELEGGRVESFEERYADRSLRAMWSARILPNGRYLLDGRQVIYYENGRKEYEVTYVNGFKTGAETYWDPFGNRVWSWTHDRENHRSVWTQYWPDGSKRLESNWNTRPRARDIDREFTGLVAHGPALHFDREGREVNRYEFVNGVLQSGAVAAGAR